MRQRIFGFASPGMLSVIAFLLLVPLFGPPAASFSVTNPNWLGQPVVFTNTTLTDPPGDPTVTYHWSFGDGSESSEANPTHTYSEPGVFEVFLTASNPAGESVSSTPVTVYSPPVADFTGSISHEDDSLVVQFINMSYTNPIGDQTLTYFWEFGDGETSTLASPLHVYSIRGEGYVQLFVRLTVSNAAGSSQKSVRILVFVPPSPAFHYYIPILIH